MVVKRKKALCVLLCITVLICSCFVFVLNLFKGPTLIVNNCNSNTIFDSRVCQNSKGYYYLNSSGTIFHYTDEIKEVFNNTQKINYITCNSDYLYATDKESLFQYNLDGKLINSLNSNSSDYIYSSIDGIYATDNCVFCCMGSSYLLINPISLEPISINDIIEKGKWETFDSVQIALDSNVKMVSSSIPVEANECTFSGILIFNDHCVLNLCHDSIVGLSDTGCVEYKPYNGTILKNLYNEAEYNIEKTDIRHIYLAEDLLISFNSNYNDNSFLKNFCFLTDEYDALDFGLYDELPLMFHNSDKINIISLKDGKKNSIKTKPGEKIIYLSNKTAVSYYKEMYNFYNIDTWNRYKSISAKEIDNSNTYRFESCGDYIFVFDDNSGELLNTISLVD